MVEIEFELLPSENLIGILGEKIVGILRNEALTRPKSVYLLFRKSNNLKRRYPTCYLAKLAYVYILFVVFKVERNLTTTNEYYIRRRRSQRYQR